MTQPFLGQIEIFSFNFAPKGWANCSGQLLPINQNQALFSLLGTTFGGDGRTTFGLPDLRGRVPISQSNGYIMGQISGEENHTLLSSEMPLHTHQMNANNSVGNTQTPATNATLGKGTGVQNPGGNFNISIYSNQTTPATSMSMSTIGNVGGSQAHNNMMPFLVLNVCIATSGIFPSRN
jgi:microcystin-dependent protein